ncbi:hypothetical protein skT53_20850 [Effusibacillus dendaii]|uniref:Cyclodeaminase/cyclohydrolase domain-containing protein n=1 Tax=Effusibacillus dendaii TaxID=2743772 RepID=A0A7I8DEW4_9BACL|nr:hypothetical protein skT53_20850 [Effusibacillus dendaii]
MTGLADADWSMVVREAVSLSENMLRFADEDVQMVAHLYSGSQDICIRKQIAPLAKVASGLVKLLTLVEERADRFHPSVLPDVRVIAHLARGAADGILELERSDLVRSGNRDAVLMRRIEEWRDRAHAAADRILHKVRER